MIALAPVEQQVAFPDEWQVGFNAYCDGAEFNQEAPALWLRGWWAALSAQAEVAEYHEDILDRDYWARGEW